MHIGVKQPRVRTLLGRMLTAALTAVDPFEAMRQAVTRKGMTIQVGEHRYDLNRYTRIFAIGAGKASARMAAALEQRLGARLTGGSVVVKYGHSTSTSLIDIQEAGHPVPDLAGQQAAGQILSLLNQLTADDLVFVLLSGGASSLLPAPAPGVTLADKQRATALLLLSGATIYEINAVRKHLSAMKGGRMAAATRARMITLILSDVLGDDLGTIGSGPTAPDETTYADAIQTLRRYGIWKKVSTNVRTHLLKGQRGAYPESPKPGARIFSRVQNHIIGNNQAAVESISRVAKQAGLHPLILTTSLQGEAREAAKWFGAIAREIIATGRPIQRPACLIAGGELTVTVRGKGRGGRAQEFALAAARGLAGLPNVWIAGFGTDGTDGPTDAAGAVSDGQTLARAARLDVNPMDSLDRNDAYHFFKAVGGLIHTGPTGTNVNDLYLLIAL
ncbi:MAG: glycerate kinase [Nitrospirota bacterium]|nr:glycerate kinase [Nitrospirota bacterium]